VLPANDSVGCGIIDAKQVPRFGFSTNARKVPDRTAIFPLVPAWLRQTQANGLSPINPFKPPGSNFTHVLVVPVSINKSVLYGLILSLVWTSELHEGS